MPDAGERRRSCAARLAFADDAAIVAGWGTDPWMDGQDLFVETLRSLTIDLGLNVHGVWLGIDPESKDGTAMKDLADRIGVGDRLAVVPDDGDHLRRDADVALLPSRVEPGQHMVLATVTSGTRVVMFSKWPMEHPRWLYRVPERDATEAASAIARMLADSDDGWRHECAATHDLSAWCSRLLEEIGSLRLESSRVVTRSLIPSMRSPSVSG